MLDKIKSNSMYTLFVVCCKCHSFALAYVVCSYPLQNLTVSQNLYIPPIQYLSYIWNELADLVLLFFLFAPFLSFILG